MIVVLIGSSCLVAPMIGCAHDNYYQMRQLGQMAMIDSSYAAARHFFEEAEHASPRHVENLHDLGACSVAMAKEKFALMNHAAAVRELDAAIAYYTRAIDAHPGHQASLEGKNVALELKGQFDEALEHAEWAAQFVGPSAKQYMFLAGELEQRGDDDGALLRYRQAVAVEPANAEAHRTFAKFLLAHGNETAAVYHLQRSYVLKPSDPWVREQLISRGALPALADEPMDPPTD